MSIVVSHKRKILGIGPAQGAHAEFEQLAKDYDVHMITRGVRVEVR